MGWALARIRKGIQTDPGAALAGACAALKIFPLPGVVLLPGAPAPFHLFEPRYRALGAAVLDGDRVLADQYSLIFPDVLIAEMMRADAVKKGIQHEQDIQLGPLFDIILGP